MPLLRLVLSDRDDPQLVETYFEYARGNSKSTKKATRGSDSGCFGWTRGVQAITVFLLRWVAWGRQRVADPKVVPPDIQGHRHSLAATLNDALTKKPAWLSEIFGSDTGGNPRVEFIGRTNPDFKTVPNAPVRLWLDCDELPPAEIEVLVSGARVENPDVLNALADKIVAKHFHEQTSGVPVSDSGLPSAGTGIRTDDRTASGVETLPRDSNSLPVSAASALKGEVLSYLKKLTEDCATLPYYFPPHLKDGSSGKSAFESIRPTVRVFEDRSAFHEWLAAERERLYRERVDTDGLKYSPDMGIPKEKGAADRHLGVSVKTIPWDERVSRRFHRATILGEPGFGKSWLLRCEARQLACKAIEQLTSGSARTDDIELPFLVRLPDLAGRKGTLEDRIVTTIAQEPLSCVHEYVRGQLRSNHGVVLLDAWDEVPYDRKEELKERIHEFAHQYPARILLTSRGVGYELPQPPLPDGKELELLAWNWSQIESFVRKWFGPAEGKAKRFLHKLRGDPQFRGLASIPLMLMLLCRAYPYGVFPARRSDVYRDCLWGLLRDWHAQDKMRVKIYTKIQRSDSYVRGLIEILERVALELCEKGRQQFREDEICPVIESFLNDLYMNRPAHEFKKEEVTPGVLVERFKDDGVLISSASVGRELRFLHLAFQEHLAARALAKRLDCIDKALEHVYEPAWNQVLTMLGGLLDQPGPYMAALLRKNREDLLCRPFLLAVRAAAEADRRRLPKGLLSGLADEALRIYLNITLRSLLGVTRRVVTCLPASLGSLIALLRGGRVDERLSAIGLLHAYGAEQAISPAINAMKDESEYVRAAAVEALGRPGSEDAVPALLDALKDESERVCLSAAGALGRIGSEDAVPALLEALKDESAQVRLSAAGALGSIGSEDAVPVLLDALRDESAQVRLSAAGALGSIGSEDAVPVLLEAMKDESADIRRAAAEALGRIGSENAVPALLDAMKDESGFVSCVAVEALGRIGSEDVVAALLDAMKDESEHIRCMAAQALGRIGSDDAVAALLDAMRDESEYVRAAAVVALGGRGSEDAVPALLDALKDESEKVRTFAVVALGGRGSEDAVAARLDALKDESADVRCWAVRALGATGSGDAVAALIDALKDESEKVCLSAAGALGSIGSEDAVPALLEVMKDESADIRRAAAEASGRIGSENAVPALLDALKDESADVRWLAAEALGRIGSEDAVPALLDALKDESADIYWAAAPALNAVCVKLTLLTAAGDVPVGIRRYLESLADLLEHLAELCEEHGETPQP